jgi:ferredoxin
VDQRISELQIQLHEGKITRRDFIRFATILGFSLGVAEILAACAPLPGPTPTPGFQAFIPDTDNIVPTPPGGVVEMPTSTAGPEPPPATEAAPSPAPTPRKKIAWLCASCGERFQTVEALKRHVAQEHSWRLPEIRKVDQPTYSEFLVGRIERFDEKHTVFSRTVWDEKYKALVHQAAEKTPENDLEVLEEQALVAGAIYVDDTAGTLHPDYWGYSGHLRNFDGLYGWDDPVNPTKFPVPDPVWMSERLKTVAKFYGADLVGICKLDQRWVYSHYFERQTAEYGQLEVPYKYAVVMGIEMDWTRINESPGLEASAATALAYSQMAELAASLAKYIRALGYPAIPCGNDTAQSIPLAIDAGLGELGRNGLLISPEYGPRQRICKVLTDLPLQPDRPIDFGLRNFCETCHICAKTCPVKAIRGEERTTETTSISNRPGILRWPVNVTKCHLFWQENGADCSNCVAVCPWAMRVQRDWLER